MFSNLDNLWTKQDLLQRVLTVIPLPESTRDEVLQSIAVLFVSTDVNETLAIHSYMQPLNGHEYVYHFTPDKSVYIGRYGTCPAAVVDVADGFEVHGSIKTISTVANQWFPNLCTVVSVGVAYGIKGKVQIFDVLVSSQVVNYDQALNSEQIHSPRDKPISVSPWLKKLFNQPVHWPNDTIKTRLVNNGISMPNVVSGAILSGSLYDAGPAMNNLIRSFASKVIGIEMQRGYHFTESTVNAIIVKAVCDFGGGKDNVKYQPTAALLAADLIHTCLSSHQASEELKGLYHCLVKHATS